MRSLILAAIFAASTAIAEEAVYKGEGVTVRLSQEACRHPVLAAVLTEAGIEGKARTATVVLSGMEIPGCWGVFEDKVLLGDLAGNAGFVLLKDFKPSPGV